DVGPAARWFRSVGQHPGVGGCGRVDVSDLSPCGWEPGVGVRRKARPGYLIPPRMRHRPEDHLNSGTFGRFLSLPVTSAVFFLFVQDLFVPAAHLDEFEVGPVVEAVTEDEKGPHDEPDGQGPPQGET